MSSNSESVVSELNKSSTTTSQPFANTQTMTTKDNNNTTDTLTGNKTVNVAVILGIVQAICKVLDKVPYVKVVTGLASTAIKVINVHGYFAVSLLY